MSIKNPLSLQRCLTAQSWHTLYALSRANTIPFHGQWSQSEAAAALATAFHERPLTPLLNTVSSEARAALCALLRAGGQLAQDEFVYRFGEYRPYRPWREDAPAAPWEQPRSPTEALLYRGLVFPLNLGTTERPVEVLALPAEYHEPLRSRFEIEAPDPVPAPRVTPRLLQHLFAFLSYLHRQRVEPLHGRWLAPRHFRALAPLLDAHASEAATARSELQFRYLVFVHYLAERAELVDLSAGCLRPTAAAWAWLDQTPRDQLQSLWELWRAPDAANTVLWQRYRLPLRYTETPPARLQQLAEALARHPPEDVTLEAYVAALQETAPRLFRPQAAYQTWAEIDSAAQAAYRAQASRALTRLINGPLTWLGIVQQPLETLTLTGWGAALIGREDGAWPAPRAPVRLQIVVEASPELAHLYVVTRQAGDEGRLTPARRLTLERWLPPDPERPQRYLMRKTPVQRALQDGAPVERLLTVLEAAAGPLPPLVVGTLYRWAAAVNRLRVRRITVLEAQEAELLQTLTTERRIRETLLETLSARAVRVDAAQLDALLRRLAHRELYPRVDVPSPDAQPPSELSAEERSTIGAALALYATLADRLGADLRPPHTLARQWRRRLTDAERDAADRQVERLRNALRQATPPPTEDHLPVPTGRHLTVLEQAIAAGATVELRYYTAGRDHVTHRRVDPLRLEWRGEVAYLIAYCHLRQAQRVFRVERIEALTLVGG